MLLCANNNKGSFKYQLTGEGAVWPKCVYSKSVNLSKKGKKAEKRIYCKPRKGKQLKMEENIKLFRIFSFSTKIKHFLLFFFSTKGSFKYYSWLPKKETCSLIFWKISPETLLFGSNTVMDFSTNWNKEKRWKKRKYVNSPLNILCLKCICSLHSQSITKDTWMIFSACFKLLQLVFC